MAKESKIGSASLKNRWENPQQIQGTEIVFYFSPEEETNFLKTKLRLTGLVDYALDQGDESYRGKLIPLTNDLRAFLESDSYLMEKNSYLSIANNFQAEIDRLRRELEEAKKGKTVRAPRAPRASKDKEDIGERPEDLPKFRGQVGALNGWTKEHIELRAKWREIASKHPDLNNDDFASWVRDVLKTPKSAKAIQIKDEKGLTDIDKWNKIVDDCLDWDAKNS